MLDTKYLVYLNAAGITDAYIRAFSVHAIGTWTIDTDGKGRCPISISLREVTRGYPKGATRAIIRGCRFSEAERGCKRIPVTRL